MGFRVFLGLSFKMSDNFKMSDIQKYVTDRLTWVSSRDATASKNFPVYKLAGTLCNKFYCQTNCELGGKCREAK